MRFLLLLTVGVWWTACVPTNPNPNPNPNPPLDAGVEDGGGPLFDAGEPTDAGRNADGGREEVDAGVFDAGVDEEDGGLGPFQPPGIAFGLEVHSDGQPIGHLVDISGATITIYDVAEQTLFELNAATGFLNSSSIIVYFNSDDCTGDMFIDASAWWCDEAPQTSTPWDNVIAVGGGGFGPAADRAFRYGGAPLVPAEPQMNSSMRGHDGVCETENRMLSCGRRVDEVAFPTAFAMPITIVDPDQSP